MPDSVIDRESFTFKFERSLRASREDVFDAWTRPEQLSEWCETHGTAHEACAGWVTRDAVTRAAREPARALD
ncbi:MAG: SRPBCC domain-containing protein [Polyangiaceae bacterium]